MASRIKSLITAALVIFSSACTSGGSDSGSPGSGPSLAGVAATSGATNSSGEVVLSLNLPAGITAFQVVASAPDAAQLRLLSLVGPDGATLISAAQPKVSGATTVQTSPATLNYPAGPAQGAASAGVYKARYQTLNQKGLTAGGVSVTATVVGKRDTDFSSGTLHLNLILAGPVADAEDVREAIELSLEEEVEAIFRNAGISITVSFHDYPSLPAQMPAPGDSIYEVLTTQVGTGLSLVFAVDVDGLKAPQDQYALAGSITCPAVPSAKSSIVLSVGRLSGSDGSFDGDSDGNAGDFEDEVKLLGQTMAHYIGRCLGLFPTMEFKGQKVTASDALSDTTSCIDLDACEDDKSANQNLMFPFVLKKEDESRQFYSRDTISEQQRAVIQRSVLID